MKSVTEMSEKLHILTCLSARENYIDFRHREIFKTYIISDDLLLKMKATQFIKMSGSTTKWHSVMSEKNWILNHIVVKNL